MKNCYEDMIHLPHHVSQKHPQMTMQERAAQFSPFAALTGYGDAIKETARITESKPELDEGEKEKLSRQLQAAMREKQIIKITYYVPDAKKDGGTYFTVTGYIKKIDEYEKQVKLTNGINIPLENIREAERSASDHIL